jgi:hypothetical protein
MFASTSTGNNAPGFVAFCGGARFALCFGFWQCQFAFAWLI